MGKLTLKKVKVHEDMSEETICFSAELYDDGKLVAYVSNRGHGGSNELSPALKGLKYSDVAKYDNIDTECDIMTMVEEINVAKKYQTKSLVLKKGDNIYTRKTPNNKSFAQLKKYGNYKEWLEIEVKKAEAEGYKVLNTNL